jgi:hypothetical protein
MLLLRAPPLKCSKAAHQYLGAKIDMERYRDQISAGTRA